MKQRDSDKKEVAKKEADLKEKSKKHDDFKRDNKVVFEPEGGITRSKPKLTDAAPMKPGDAEESKRPL